MMGSDAAMSVDLEIIVDDMAESQKRELRLWLRLLSTTKLVSQEIRRRLRRDFGATLPQFDLLAQLYRENEGLRLGELSKRTMVTNGNVTGLVDRLEKEGLVRRQTPGQDRRVTVACLTEPGRQTFAKMAKAHEGWLREIMADLDQKTIGTLLSDVGLLRSSARNHLSGSDEDQD